MVWIVDLSVEKCACGYLVVSQWDPTCDMLFSCSTL